jgi:hypothetical protein
LALINEIQKGLDDFEYSIWLKNILKIFVDIKKNNTVLPINIISLNIGEHIRDHINSFSLKSVIDKNMALQEITIIFYIWNVLDFYGKKNVLSYPLPLPEKQKHFIFEQNFIDYLDSLKAGTHHEDTINNISRLIQSNYTNVVNLSLLFKPHEFNILNICDNTKSLLIKSDNELCNYDNPNLNISQKSCYNIIWDAYCNKVYEILDGSILHFPFGFPLKYIQVWENHRGVTCKLAHYEKNSDSEIISFYAFRIDTNSEEIDVESSCTYSNIKDEEFYFLGYIVSLVIRDFWVVTEHKGERSGMYRLKSNVNNESSIQYIYLPRKRIQYSEFNKSEFSVPDKDSQHDAMIFLTKHVRGYARRRKILKDGRLSDVDPLKIKEGIEKGIIKHALQEYVRPYKKNIKSVSKKKLKIYRSKSALDFIYGKWSLNTNDVSKLYNPGIVSEYAVRETIEKLGFSVEKSKSSSNNMQGDAGIDWIAKCNNITLLLQVKNTVFKPDYIRALNGAVSFYKKRSNDNNIIKPIAVSMGQEFTKQDKETAQELEIDLVKINELHRKVESIKGSS